MVNVSIDTELYNQIKEHVKKHKLHYPSVRFFVQRAALSALENERESR